jgi:hypothetical protein
MLNARLGKSPEAKSQLKQIGVPPFNAGRKILPVNSGAAKLRSLRFLDDER